MSETSSKKVCIREPNPKALPVIIGMGYTNIVKSEENLRNWQVTIVEIRVLRYFLMVAREENITRAAELLHITQPTLSRQLMQLEEELGTKLFKRSNHNIYLTEDGMLLKKRAHDIVTLADRTQKEFSSKGEENISGEIFIGSGETRSVHDLAKVIASFQKEYPLVQFDLYTANADDIKDRLDKGLADIGILAEPVDISRYNFIRLNRKEHWGILVRSDCELVKKEQVTPEDLLNVPILMVKRLLVKNELEGWFGDCFDRLHIVGTYNLINNAATLVENGIGAALCFQLDNMFENLKFIPLSPAVETGTVLVWKKNQILSKSAYRFLENIKKYFKSISSQS